MCCNHLDRLPIEICISGSCADFGSSGSGVVREWRKYDDLPSVDFGVDYVDGSDTGVKENHYQYSFVGPLSMSKGCDLSLDIHPRDYNPDEDNVEFIYRGKWIKFESVYQIIFI